MDDDAAVRDALSEALSLENFDVLQAPNGEEALEILAEQRDSIGLVLLDLMMPVLSGPEVLTEVAQHPLFANLPVVVMTAAEMGAAGLPGVSAVLRKPFSMEALLGVVRAHMLVSGRS